MLIFVLITRVSSDTYDTSDAKVFFEQNYSYIYYIFYDVFTNVESDLKQRGELYSQYCLLRSTRISFCMLWDLSDF